MHCIGVFLLQETYAGQFVVEVGTHNYGRIDNM